MHPSLQEYTVEAVARDCTNCDQLAQLFSSYQVNKKLSMVSAFFVSFDAEYRFPRSIKRSRL